MMNKLNVAAALVAVVAALLSPTALAAASPTESRLPKLIDLGADKCIPCKKMAPILEQLKKEYAGQMDVEFIDVWKNEGAAKKYKIKLIPTQIFYGADGKELFRHEGFFGKEDILAKWKELGVKLSGKSSDHPAQ
jgi:thioredoxin 1